MLNRLSLNKLSLNRVDLNRIGARDVGVSGRPYIDPELLSHVKMAISTWGKSNDDPDRAILKDLSGNGNDMRLLNFSFTEGSGYGLPRTDFEGALITDGIDDQIVSTKTIQEMLGGSNDITVVSMIYHINSRLSGGSGYTNYIDNNLPTGQQYFRNKVISQGFGKWGIYGYSSKNNAIPVPITNILGDKADYSSGQSGTYDGLLSSNAKFSPIGRSQIAGSDTSSCAWYWTILADKVLTTDEINQIIAYFNLDRPGQIIKPQLYCNIKKQGITNDNHAEFNDQLIDFVGGRNIQLNNVAWEGGSGIIEGALFLDGISDFGKATGLPILKDYTVVADREIEKSTGGIVSKDNPDGAFICEVTGEAYSYGAATSVSIDYKRKISYQSKYIYNGSPIQSGTGVDSDSMWLGTPRDGDSRFSKFALWSLMLFPYSLSEFLLERQLKKYKAGTLYPDMIEFRPIVKSNIPYSSISYSVNPGVYVTEGSTVTITITLSNETDKLVGVSSNAISDISISGDNGTYEITGKVTKSPQKINIIISSYLTMLGNETLISNETLIKNE